MGLRPGRVKPSAGAGVTPLEIWSETPILPELLIS